MPYKFPKGKRDQIEKHILKRMKQVDSSGYNHRIWKDMLVEMSDQQLNDVINGEGVPLYTELGGSFVTPYHEVAKLIEDEMGVPVYQHIYLTNPKTGIKVKSIHAHMIGRAPVRTQTQSYEKKSSIPIHNRLIDAITNQVTGSGISRSSSISSPESMLMMSEGYLDSTKEMVNARGGNQDLQRAIHAEILATGKGRLDQPHLADSQAKAPKVMGRIYRAMHIGTNMDLER